MIEKPRNDLTDRIRVFPMPFPFHCQMVHVIHFRNPTISEVSDTRIKSGHDKLMPAARPTQTNTNLALSLTPGVRVPNTDWKLTLPLTVTGRVYENVLADGRTRDFRSG